MVRIFHLLPHEDLKTVMLVCKVWKDFVEDPTLWTWLEVKVNRREDFLKLGIPRLQLIETVDLWHYDVCHLNECDYWIELFQLMLNMTKLTRITGYEFWSITDLSFMEPELLVTVFQRLEKLSLGKHLSPEQSTHLFSAMAENKCNLKLLELKRKSTVTISPELFASALSNVEKVDLSDKYTTKEQMEALFKAMVKEDIKVRQMLIFECECEGVEPELVGNALSRLESVNIGVRFETKQLTSILENAVDDQSKLKKIILEIGYDVVCYFDGQDSFLLDHLVGEFDLDLVKLAKDKFGRFYYYDWDSCMRYEEVTSEEGEENADDDDEEDVGNLNTEDYQEGS